MKIARTLSELRAIIGLARPIGLVPTMGGLHEGHHALVQAAVARGGLVVASIFVNPLQFGQSEDFARYPRDEAADAALLTEWGCDVLWAPDVSVMYPSGDSTTIEPGGPAEGWESDARPGHFRGVATVCAKLFGQVRPDWAFFGEKDWQQLQVVRRMVTDLALPLEIVSIETVRGPDGLALSSRNRFLTPPERTRATLLHATMVSANRAIGGGAPISDALAVGRDTLTAKGFAVDYFDAVDGASLIRLQAMAPGARLIAAARLGTVRLLDNIAI